MAQVESVESSQTEISVILYRLFSWCSISLLFAFLINNHLNYWQSWPGSEAVFTTSNASTLTIILSLTQILFYIALVAIAVTYVFRTTQITLRQDSKKLYALTAYIVRGAFWAVLLVGVVDVVISFLRYEDILPAIVGSELAEQLAQKSFRGGNVHIPLIALGFVIAYFHKGLGFPWLALLVVVAELVIVLANSVYSYEQTLFGDLVRFWYAALFLFASAHTLLEEGHVRVDLLYAGLSKTAKGRVNAFGSILLGMTLCWVIILFGMESKFSIINAPILSHEVTQQKYGMQVKYWMAAFLAVFAVSMLIQFAGYFLENMADWRGDPDEEDDNKKETQ